MSPPTLSQSDMVAKLSPISGVENSWKTITGDIGFLKKSLMCIIHFPFFIAFRERVLKTIGLKVQHPLFW